MIDDPELGELPFIEIAKEATPEERAKIIAKAEAEVEARLKELDVFKKPENN